MCKPILKCFFMVTCCIEHLNIELFIDDLNIFSFVLLYVNLAEYASNLISIIESCTRTLTSNSLFKSYLTLFVVNPGLWASINQSTLKVCLFAVPGYIMLSMPLSHQYALDPETPNNFLWTTKTNFTCHTHLYCVHTA